MRSEDLTYTSLGNNKHNQSRLLLCAYYHRCTRVITPGAGGYMIAGET